MADKLEHEKIDRLVNKLELEAIDQKRKENGKRIGSKEKETSKVTKLYILEGPCKGQSFDIKSDDFIIGRSPDNDIQIKDKSVSRSHLRIVRKIDDLSVINLRSTFRKTNKYLIRDLKSTNGTFVEGERVSSGVEFEVNEGVPISIGKSLICIGEECLEDIESAQDSGEPAKKAPVNGKEAAKTRPFTFQKNMELMYNVCHVLMESLDMDDILQKILDQILDLFKRTDRGVIILIDHVTKSISKEISRIKGGSKETGKWYSLDVVEQVIENGRAVIISDVYLEVNDGLSGTLEIMKIGSVMCVPLMSKSQLWGVIYVDSVDKAYGFREEDLDLLTALSTPMALAIENAFLHSGENSMI